MELLDKKQIVQQKSQERKTEIDQGVLLAKKIDALRETYAKEEQKLSLFRSENLKHVKKELDVLTEKKREYQSEIKALEKRCEELKKPLDAEWEELSKAQNSLEKLESEYRIKISDFLTKERLQKEREKEIQIEESRIRDLRDSITKSVIVSERDRKVASEVLDSAKTLSGNMIQEAQVRLDSSVSREMEVAARERDIINSKKVLDRRESELDSRERAINDKYQTLLRSIKRLNKKP